MRASSSTKTEPCVASSGQLEQRKKHVNLNKFLAKTYHCISECDPSIACWSNGGTSFTIKDVKTFEKTILPKYFNHSRFDSFARQLNFYSFRKSTTDHDLQVNCKSVRYSHEFFRQGCPELLQKIRRTTANKTQIVSESAASLRKEITTLKNQIEDLDRRMDERIQAEVHLMTLQYSSRMKNLQILMEKIIRSSTKVPKLIPEHSSSQHWETATSLAHLADHIRSNVRNSPVDNGKGVSTEAGIKMKHPVMTCPNAKRLSDV